MLGKVVRIGSWAAIALAVVRLLVLPVTIERAGGGGTVDSCPAAGVIGAMSNNGPRHLCQPAAAERLYDDSAIIAVGVAGLLIARRLEETPEPTDSG